MSKTHELKIYPKYFEAILDGKKTFEIRKNDRYFHVGDRIVLKEWIILSIPVGKSMQQLNICLMMHLSD